MTTIDHQRFQRARETVRRALLETRTASGHWEGELSSSALSTATTVCALAIWQREMKLPAADATATKIAVAVQQGLQWLANHANPDGGWGDTLLSISNISTTTLCWAAFGSVPGADAQYAGVVARAEKWLAQKAGGCTPEHLVPAIVQRYGKDRTFSVPILTMCALSGRLGQGEAAWKHVLALPFELAAFPPAFFAAMRLPVVSYALPALIAIGQVRHHHLPSRNPFARFARHLARDHTLQVLTGIQPASGGFLEAAPLTSFVTMSLAASGNANHVVARKGVEFLLASLRPDGSWPIDTNLATWVTTLSINALTTNVPLPLPDAECERLREWLISQQYRVVHPYTNSPPGGWAWTNLAGGVPDGDDTPGALLALHRLGIDARTREAGGAGVQWLINLQNRDGGIPTFCRGWGALPFDRSSPDLTAHALRAWAAWERELGGSFAVRIRRAIAEALKYLARSQQRDGSWIPLWFGNQHAPDDINPTYGTARVLQGLQAMDESARADDVLMETRGAEWLLDAQGKDGSWSGHPGGTPSVEETALAVDALTGCQLKKKEKARLEEAIGRGTEWLLTRIESGAWTQPSPIGFYFAKLWYFEKLYPLIFTTAAIEKLAGQQAASKTPH